ncbi:MAG: response regulator [Gemmatimonadetes bacterium]|nr:response regulator [Gemmatimonadota bacterium]
MSKTVLVVDDEADFRSAVRDLLGLHGFQVAEASNGVEALRVLAQERVAILMTDLFMPRMDGIELLRQVRKNREHLPGIIAVTGETHLGKQTTVAAASLLGAHVVLIKPFTTDQLLGAIAVATKAAGFRG